MRSLVFPRICVAALLTAVVCSCSQKEIRTPPSHPSTAPSPASGSGQPETVRPAPADNSGSTAAEDTGTKPLRKEIRGGQETAGFARGSVVIYGEDLSGVQLGGQLDGWEILQGSYEVAEFSGRRWIRPLTFDTHILRRISLPQDFSIEFTAYFHQPGNAELRMFLHTDEELRRGPGPDGPAQVYLTAGRVDKTDGFHLRVWEPEKRRFRDVAARGYQAYEGRGGFPPDRPHRIALQVRGGRLALFFDGERAAVIPFRPQAPIVAVSFRFLSRSGHELPYKDRPALLDGLWITAPGPRSE